MTREEAIEFGNMWLELNEYYKDSSTYAFFQMAIKALEQESTTKNNLGVREFEEIVVEYPPEDLCTYPEYKGKPYFSIKYKEGNDYIIGYGTYNPKVFSRFLRDYFMPSVTPQGTKCKDCKWWKDSDGKYRRGCGAESKCLINTEKVYKGEGYCYMFEPQESEDKE